MTDHVIDQLFLLLENEHDQQPKTNHIVVKFVIFAQVLILVSDHHSVH